MQNFFVFIIVVLAAFFIGKRLLRIFRPGHTPSCGCGCSGCGSASTCSSKKKTSS
ncbi:MAG TPA: FeoB-associated Cys-rich membrane protein [Desulfobulbus sp.]|nr:FeoB-associated Cys-rich membrane protein [Desulfobulbus sp.]